MEGVRIFRIIMLFYAFIVNSALDKTSGITIIAMALNWNAEMYSILHSYNSDCL